MGFRRYITRLNGARLPGGRAVLLAERGAARGECGGKLLWGADRGECGDNVESFCSRGRSA
jgi:hypothetical protein